MSISALHTIVETHDISAPEVREAFELLMTGQMSEAEIAALLVALRMMCERAEHISAVATVMRSLMIPVGIQAQNAVDIVGTGGDGASLFNVSTASALVAAAAGVIVAKHGSRGVSSSSGAADVLEAAGVNLDLPPSQLARLIDECGIGFMFAINHHSAMKYAAPARKTLGMRTIFNLLGPLTNPASVKRQVVGVYHRDWVRPVAEALKELGAVHALVVSSHDQLDEISLAAPTDVAELRDGSINEYVISPADFGITRADDLSDLAVDGAQNSLVLLKAAISGENEKAADMVALNAGAAIYVSGEARSLKEGVIIAQDVISTGLAKSKLAELAQMSKVMGELS